MQVPIYPKADAAFTVSGQHPRHSAILAELVSLPPTLPEQVI